MAPADRPWQELLARDPDAPLLIDGATVVTRGALAAAVAAQASAWRKAGWRSGHRLALVPDNDMSLPVRLLAALDNDMSVLLLPRREPEATRHALAQAAGAAEYDQRPPAATDGPPGRVWIRSSGSFGRPRWIIHTAATLLAGATAAAAHLDFGPGARWLLSLPMDHVGGLSLVMRALAGGGALVTGDLDGGVARDDITHVSLVPTQLTRLLDRGADLARLRCVLVGGAAVPVSLRRRALAAGAPLVVSYGLSETGALAAATAIGERPGNLYRDHYAGRPLLSGGIGVGPDAAVFVGGPALCVAIADDAGTVIPAQAPLATGDLGRLTDDELFITGRRDNVIISGGEKLPAEELESALVAMDGVVDAVVVPVPDATFGQRPAAFLGWSGEGFPTVAELRGLLAPHVAGWKHPVAVWPMPEGSGWKPDRCALAARARDLLTAGDADQD